MKVQGAKLAQCSAKAGGATCNNEPRWSEKLACARRVSALERPRTKLAVW